MATNNKTTNSKTISLPSLSAGNGVSSAQASAINKTISNINSAISSGIDVPNKKTGGTTKTFFTSTGPVSESGQVITAEMLGNSPKITIPEPPDYSQQNMASMASNANATQKLIQQEYGLQDINLGQLDPGTQALMSFGKQVMDTNKQDTQNFIDNYQEQKQSLGIDDQQRKILELNLQIGKLNEQAQLGSLKIGNEKEATPVLGREQRLLMEQNAIKVGALSAEVQARTGYVDMARQTLNDTFQMEKMALDSRTEYRNKLLGIVEKVGDVEQQKLARQEQAKLTRENAEYTQFLEAKYNAMKNNPSKASLYGSAKNINELIEYGADTRTPSEVLAAIKDSREVNGTEGTGKSTADQKKVAGFTNRIEQANVVIDEIGRQFTGVDSYFGKIVPNILKTADRQRFEQAQRNFINAVLRRESGAVISEEEFTNARQQYFPQPGDTTEVLEQKRQNRLLVQGSFIKEAGPAYEPIDPSLTAKTGFKIMGGNGKTIDLSAFERK